MNERHHNMNENDRIVITTVYERRAAFYLSDGDAVRIQVLADESSFSLGTVVVGRVRKMLESSGACFLDIGDDKDYFMQIPRDPSSIIFTDGREHVCVKPEDQMLVQVSSEEVKLKAPCVTHKITLRSRYAVIGPGKGVSFSGKIGPATKKNIILPANINTFASKYHIIIRTEAGSLSDMGPVADDLARLDEEYSSLIQRASCASVRSILHRESTGVSALMDEWLKFGASEVVTDIGEYADELGQMLKNRGVNLKLYADPDFPACKMYKLESAIDNALARRVYLHGGGFLVIEQGETLCAIDVNSGHRIRGDKEEMSYRINLDAAEEISRQLRLRNISGMILIDFINLKDPGHMDDLIAKLRGHVRKDDVQCRYVDVTGLGLIELTRKRVRKSISEQWKASN